MNACPRSRFVTALLTLTLLLGAWPAAAQVVRNFTPRYSTNDNGDITMIGNTLMSCTGNGQCTQGRNGNGNSVDDNDWNMAYIDVDADNTTFCSSNATLTLPAGATVSWAGLYWQGDSNNGTRNTCKFRTPSTGSYQTLTASRLDVSGTVYQGFTDVTALVQSAGAGTYWIANVQSTNNTANVFAGWGLVVVYRLASAPPRNLVVFDGFALVQTGNTVAFNVSGFVTPPAGAVNTKLGVITGEGDLGYTGDSFLLNGVALADANNPADNFFNSSVSLLGVTFTAKNPNFLNQYGWDVDLVNAGNILPNGATSATITLTSTNDTYYPGVVSFATDLYSPVVSGNGFYKSVTDLNGGTPMAGDVLEYAMTFHNTGNDGATSMIARDTLAANLTYVPGSLVVVNGANAGAKTDVAGDDQAEYDAANRRVIFRIGTGATGAAGGSMAPGVATTVRFRATINSPTKTGTVVTNQANVAFNGAQLGTPFTSESDGDTTTAGIQRTVVTVTAPRMLGTVFEDVNYGGGIGRSLAASAGVARPGARVELYSAAGAYLEADTTNVAGLYTIDGYAPGSYQVRVVHATVTSSRTGATSTLRGVPTYRTDAGSGAAAGVTDRVGGEVPSLQDGPANTTNATLASLTTSTTTAESVTPVTMGTAGVTGIDFGFNFDTITNTNDGGGGSLRQFILNADALSKTGLAQSALAAGTETSIFMVSDGLAHPGLRAGLANLLTGNVVVIAPVSALPALTLAFTRVDGGTQTTDVRDANTATLGTGGAVGVDALALPTVAGPEIEIRGVNGIGVGLDLQATDLTIARLAIRGFGGTTGSDANTDIRVGAGGARATITACVIGTSASSFTDPGAGARSGGDHLRVLGAASGSITNSVIGYGAGSGIALTAGATGWSVSGCELRGGGITDPTRAALSLEAGGSATVSGDLVAGNHGAGIDALTSTGANALLDCTVTRDGTGAALATVTAGIRLGGSGNRVDHDVVTQNYGAGVLVVSSSTTSTITHNSITDNGTIVNDGGATASGEIGIDLESTGQDLGHGTAPYVTLNDNDDTDTGANGLLNYPVVATAVLSNGTFTFSGWARPGSTVELFVASPDPSGFGEGQTWVGSFVEGSASDLDALTGSYSGSINGIAQGTDNTNRFRFSLAAPAGVSPGVRLTATATLAGNTSEFSGVVTVATGVTVGGNVYLDADHNRSRGGGEAGIGVASYVKLVPVASPGTAQDVASVNPATGVYSFGAVNAAQYSLVLDDNNTPGDVTATDPAGFVGTQVPGGVRLATVGGTDLAAQDFGLWAGSRLDGTVFRDDGAGGGVANDGARQAGETGVGALRVRAVSGGCAGGCDSTLTDGGGRYTLWLPSATAGQNVSLTHADPAGWLATGASVGSTAGVYTRANDALVFTPANGRGYSGADLGAVPPNPFGAPGVKTGVAGGSVAYAHTFVAGSAGTVSFSAVETPTPVVPGWGTVLYRDTNCNGVVDPGESAVTAPLAVGTGQTVCLVLEHRSPVGAKPGDAERVTIGASMSYLDATPALVSVVNLDDRTTVITAGGLELVKSVDLVSARPGDVLTYTITYRNLGAQPLSAILIRDATPAHTVFVGASCGALGGGLGGCALSAQPSVGSTGNVTWSLAGALSPGASGTVTFQVKVQ